MPPMHMRSFSLRALFALLFSLSVFSGVASAGDDAQDARGAAVITIRSPASLRGKYLGYFGDFSGKLGMTTEAQAWTPETGNTQGCSPYMAPVHPRRDASHARERNRDRPAIALVDRGGCTFLQKALNAQAAGAIGLIVAYDTDELFVMGGDNESKANVSLFAVSMQHTLGAQIQEWNNAHASDDRVVVLSVKPFVPPTDNFLDMYSGLVIQLLVATSLVTAGSHYAIAELPHAQEREEVLEITRELALGYCVLGSATLVFLFFFMKYAIYFMMFSFSIGGSLSCLHILSVFLQCCYADLRKHVFKATSNGCILTYADVLASIPSTLLGVGWAWFRNTDHGYIFQDIIGAGLLVSLQRQLRLPNIKVATIFLVSMFFFDIFWVFISPVLFTQSVMVEVAKGGDTGEAVPMLIRIPDTSSGSTGGEHMLGFGDIALPGLLMTYLLRHDVYHKQRHCSGYFIPGVIGYAGGLVATMVALTISRTGQPALLYLVPSTLGTTLVLGCCRGQLRSLWDGIPEEAESNGQGDCGVGGDKVAVVDWQPRPVCRMRGTQPEVDGASEHEMQALVLGVPEESA